jgi:hypothetical protein
MSHPHQNASLKRRLSLLLLLIFPIFVALASLGPERSATAAATQATAAAQKPFPDFGFLPGPSSYTGPVFELSQDYPKVRPPRSRVPAFFSKLPSRPFSSDFSAWRDYMIAVRDYCFEGNITGQSVENDFRVQSNNVRKWYHIPWQHYGPSGREGVHGLTKEAAVQPYQLAPTQSYQGGQTYAVGFFNEFAGYAIGRVWADHMNPDPSFTTVPQGGFPEGTVIFKLLFVDVPIDQVPSLSNPVQWTGYITDVYKSSNRSFRTVSLIQMDIAIKDSRAPTGWLFGTFQYNGQVSGKAAWTNLVPVGIMWGNDPQVTDDAYTNPTPTVTKINPNLKETSINPNAQELPPTHLGWNGRLNGPVDNPKSSCMSCHMTAEVPALSPANPTFQPSNAIPPVGSPVNQPPPAGFTGTWYGGWMRWFQNIRCGEPFDAPGNPWTKDGAKSCDFSLQLSQSITNFYTWRDTEDGLYADDYSPQTAASSVVDPAMVGTDSGAAKEKARPFTVARPGAKVRPTRNRAVHPVVRDIADDKNGKPKQQ